MKPKEQFLRAARDVVEQVTNRWKVLLNRAVTALRSVEADAFR